MVLKTGLPSILINTASSSIPIEDDAVFKIDGRPVFRTIEDDAVFKIDGRPVFRTIYSACGR